MGLAWQLIFVIIQPLFAFFLAVGATVGVATSVIIMNLLVGYFSVAEEAYTSVHPHIVIKDLSGSDDAAELARMVTNQQPDIQQARPALHFENVLTVASVNVLSDLCDPMVSVEANCAEDRKITSSKRTYAYDVKQIKRQNIQVRGITIVNNDTAANYKKLMAGSTNFTRLTQIVDRGGNRLPVAFIAQDSLVGGADGNYLLERDLLANSYEHYYRLQGVISLGAKTSGAPLLVLALEQARALAPPGIDQANVVEIRLKNPLNAESIAASLRPNLTGTQKIETWIDKERPAFEFLQATWIMVFSIMLSTCLVVAISIYSTLTLSVVRNQWKVALLGVLGATQARIGRLFIYFAMAVALIGTALGITLGYFASREVGAWLYENHLNVPREKFIETLSAAPSIWMGIATTIIFLISAILPALRATRIRPANAMNRRA